MTYLRGMNLTMRDVLASPQIESLMPHDLLNWSALALRTAVTAALCRSPRQEIAAREVPATFIVWVVSDQSAPSAGSPNVQARPRRRAARHNEAVDGAPRGIDRNGVRWSEVTRDFRYIWMRWTLMTLKTRR